MKGNIVRRSVTISEGEIYLNDNALLFYDFTKLTGAGGDISNGNLGLVDQSGNGFTGTIISTPDVENQTIGLYTVPSLETLLGESTAITTAHNGSSFFSSDFEIFFGVSNSDGQHASTQWYCGTTHSTFSDIFRVSTNGAGRMVVRYANGGQNGEWTSTAAVFANGANAHAVFRIQMDFTTNTFGVWKDGVAVAGSFTTGSMAALLPASFASDRDFYVGNQNTVSASPATILMTRFAITPLTTAQQALNVEAYFNYLPST